MGTWGIIFSAFFLPAILLCISTRRYVVVGLVMLANWLFFIIPVRSAIPFSDTPYYFMAVSTATVILLYLFTPRLIVARIIIGLIAIAVCLGYFPLAINYVSLRYTMIVADMIGFLQIIAMYGGAGGYLVNRLASSNRNAGRNSGLVSSWIQKPPFSIQMPDRSIPKEAKE